MLEVQYRNTAALRRHQSNSRTHATSQVAQIAASIERFGFTVPLVIDDDGTVLAGHGRLAAAELLKMDTVPCVTLSGLTDEQKRAYLIADNKIAANAGWDEELLKLELAELKDAGFDLGLTGFGEHELAELFAERAPKAIKGATELNPSDYDQFDHQCPKCGFEFNDD